MKERDAMESLLWLMARLRDPVSGCPWDRRQTFATIAPYTLEEAYEVVDAIERGNLDDLREELGDLLFQVVFHARLAEEQGAFDFQDVARSIVDKMLRRHPHVFADEPRGNEAEQQARWEAIKAGEKGGQSSLMDGVTAGLPEWMRALKLQKRAARVGFDWPDARGPLAKVREELDELEREMDSAQAGKGRDRLEQELGDVLFAVMNLARKLDMDPGRALRGCNRRFEQRFRLMETMADGPLSELDSVQLERLWQQAKQKLGDGP